MSSWSVEKIYDLFLQSNGISTDSRNIQEGDIFLALKGPNFDANEFATAALDKGASYSIIDDPARDQHGRTILVEDGLKCLQELAILHRQSLTIPVIGLTGSNGKTTTKELMQAVLSTRYDSFATPGNLNNHIGVPLTILKCPKNAEIMIVEMGANHVGEIARLCEISQPTFGLITNIGKDHLEGFGGPEGSLRANSELFHYLNQNDGKAFINSLDNTLMNMSKRMQDSIFYPGEEDFLHVSFLESHPFVRYRNTAGEKIQTQLAGDFNFSNICAALCVGKYFEVNSNEADKAIAAYTPLNNRSQWVEKEYNKIFLDAYNANPSSMEVALESFAKIPDSPKVVILGDMFELGDFSEVEHRKLGRLLRERRFDLVMLCGEAMKSAAEEIQDALHFQTTGDCVEYLKEHSLQDQVILIKGSRAMALERCLEYL